MIGMFVLVWATLLFASWRSSANAGTPSEETDPCQHGSCISLKVQIAAEITTEAGHSVVLPCSFTATENVTANNINWYKCEQSEQTCTKSLLESNNAKFKGRVSRMKPDCNKNCSIIIRNVTKSDSGFYQLRVHGGFSRTNVQSILSNQTKVPVTDLRQKVTVMIRQLTTGKQTTLTCTAPVDPPQSVYEITWTWNGKRITGNQTVSQGHTSNWTFNLSAEHHDTQVTCKVNFTGNIITEETVTLNVSGIKKSEISEQISTQTNDVELPMKFLNSSGCQKMSRVLTCECIVEGSPIANITWPLLQNYAEYSVITTVSNYTVRSAVTVTVTDDMNSEVECVSMSNKTKEIKLKISKKPQEDIVKKLLKFVTQLEIIVAFFTGVLLSSIFCCLMRLCCRKKQKTHGNVEALEMTTSPESPLIEDSPAAEDDHSYRQEEAEEGAGVAAGKSEVEYSTINFSASKSSSVAKLENLPETTETEYAEIKTEAEERRAGEERREMGDNEEDEENMLSAAEEGEGEDAALYSEVKDVVCEV